MICEVMIQMSKLVATGDCSSSMAAMAKVWSKRSRSTLCGTVQDPKLYPQTVVDFSMKHWSVDQAHCVISSSMAHFGYCHSMVLSQTRWYLKTCNGLSK